MAVSAEPKSPNSLTERNSNVYVSTAKYSECSYTKASIQVLQGNEYGMVIQETKLVNENEGDVHAGIECERICLTLILLHFLNTRVGDQRRRSFANNDMPGGGCLLGPYPPKIIEKCPDSEIANIQFL